VNSIDGRGLGRSAQLAVAGGLWLAVGAGLAIVGSTWLVTRGGPGTWLLAPVAILVGWAKAAYVLAPMADRNAERIRTGPARRALPAVLPARTWILGAGFMALGAVLRRSALPRDLLGLVYVAVGVALVLGSCRSWAARRVLPPA
jgi:hypothetical protein